MITLPLSAADRRLFRTELATHAAEIIKKTAAGNACRCSGADCQIVTGNISRIHAPVRESAQFNSPSGAP